ncbi:MAG: CPBP family intramembrane glutamic endopeptidase [Terracidiphilus sp.]
MPHPAILDHVFATLLVAGPLIEWRWGWPRFRARLAAGIPGTRTRYLGIMILCQWLLSLALLGWWVGRARPWAMLHLLGGTPLSIILAFLFAIALDALLAWQQRAVLAIPERIERVRAALVFAEPILPHTPSERRLFHAVSITAGFCEELLFRGFLVWYLAAWMPLFAAVTLSALIFGLGHLYLGPAQVPKTALFGLAMSLVVYAAGSLWPAMLLHTAIDWNSGEMGYRVLSRPLLKTEN